jgi:Domain of unknown function (DUF4833)
MLLTRRAALGGLTCAATYFSVPHLRAQPTRTLFVIRRSKNRNTVYFDVAKRPDTETPLAVYWRLFEEDGRAEPLSWMERQMAYGYEVVRATAPKVVQIVLKACDSRSIEVHYGQEARALIRIAGVRSVLHEIYVSADDAGLIPHVRHVDLIGTSLENGTPRRERITA